MKIENYLEKIKMHEDDPNELSKILIDITSELFYLGNQQHQANLKFAEAVIAELNSLENGKKISVAEAERRAIVNTEDEHEKIRYTRESLEELINSLKLRIKVLEDEMILQPSS